jgi:hypothetical protein
MSSPTALFLTEDAESSPPPFLFSDDVMEAMRVEESRGIYTLERLTEQHPDKLAGIIELLGRNVSHRLITAIMRVHHRTVAAVALAHPGPIDALRSKTASKLRLAAELQVERLIESPDALPLNVAGLVVAQLLEKAELLSGGATSRIESGPPKLTHDDVNAYLAALPAANAEVVPMMGLSPGNAPAIGAMAGGPAHSVSTDSQSVEANDTPFDTRRTDPDGARTGGEGGDSFAGGQGYPIHREP